MIRTYELDYGETPPSLDALVPKYTERIPTDAWGAPLIYKRYVDNRVLLSSLGADGAPGGTGPDADLWWQFSGSTTTEGTGPPPSPK